MVYLVVSFALSRRMRWPLPFTILVLLAGLIPILIFWVEHQVTLRVRRRAPGAGLGLAQAFFLGAGGALSPSAAAPSTATSSAGASGVVTGCGSSIASEIDSPGLAPAASPDPGPSTGVSARWAPPAGAEGLGGAGGAAGAGAGV